MFWGSEDNFYWNFKLSFPPNPVFITRSEIQITEVLGMNQTLTALLWKTPKVKTWLVVLDSHTFVVILFCSQLLDIAV